MKRVFTNREFSNILSGSSGEVLDHTVTRDKPYKLFMSVLFRFEGKIYKAYYVLHLYFEPYPSFPLPTFIEAQEVVANVVRRSTHMEIDYVPV